MGSGKKNFHKKELSAAFMTGTWLQNKFHRNRHGYYMVITKNCIIKSHTHTNTHTHTRTHTHTHTHKHTSAPSLDK